MNAFPQSFTVVLVHGAWADALLFRRPIRHLR
jgi:hypothetical protein